MKIAHVCPFVGEHLGGSERYVWNLSKTQKKDYDVHIYTTTRFLNRSGTSIENGITIHRAYSPVSIWNIDAICFMLRKLIVSEADVYHVHSYLYTLSAQALLAKILRKKKVLLQLHGGVGPVPYPTTFAKRIAKRIYDESIGAFVVKNSDVIASVSYCDLNDIAKKYGIRKDRTKYVPNTVDTDIFYPSKEKRKDQERVLLYIGDLEPWKGIDLLKKWFGKALKENHHSITFRFIGRGSLVNDLKKLREAFRIKNNGVKIEILGTKPHSEIPHILRNSDALVLPSCWEGMPTVLLEAMASGVPVISTPVGDIPRFVVNEESGLIINHSISNLDDAIRRVSNNDRALHRIALNARKAVEESFSLKIVNNKLRELYQTIQAS